jgi:hypothetical protein
LTVKDDREQYYDEEEVYTSSTKYHRPFCHMIEKVRRRNLKRLSSWKSAVALGLEPCGLCNPFHLPATTSASAATPQPRFGEHAPGPIQPGVTTGPTPKTVEDPEVPVADVLAWRRRIARALATLDQTTERPPNEPLAAQISRLSRQNILPRSIAQMMRTITELRNEVEHESKVLSTSESMAAWGSWLAIREWAAKEGLPL